MTKRYVQLAEDFGPLLEGAILAVKFVADDGVHCYLSYGEEIVVPVDKLTEASRCRL
jgi:hypothetical protein